MKLRKKGIVIGVLLVGSALGVWFWVQGQREATPMGTVTGTVLLGPTCPVQRIPPDPQCADKPYAAKLALASPDGSHIYATFSARADGTFSFRSSPGEFSIVSATSGLPRCRTAGTFTVRAGATVRVSVSCDTGIR